MMLNNREVMERNAFNLMKWGMRSRAKEKFSVGTLLYKLLKKLKIMKHCNYNYCSNCKEPITVKLSKFI